MFVGNRLRNEFPQFAPDIRFARAVLGLTQASRQRLCIVSVIFHKHVPERIADDFTIVLINSRLDLVFNELFELFAERYIHNTGRVVAMSLNSNCCYHYLFQKPSSL